MNYSDWIAVKEQRNTATPAPGIYSPHVSLRGYQASSVERMLNLGRGAVFLDTGLGKTRIMIDFARHIADYVGPVLLVSPLGVAAQISREAEQKMGVSIPWTKSEDKSLPIQITNYHRIDSYSRDRYKCIGLDESSILKSLDGKLRQHLTIFAENIPYRLAQTATPAPNDIPEMGQHAEFLGLCTYAEMLAEYFIHDGGNTSKWRLKGHARKSFWSWLAGWATIARKPSDMGFPNEDFNLPSLIEETISVNADGCLTDYGVMFATAVTLNDQRKVRRLSAETRAMAIADRIAEEPEEQALIWCDYNAEAEALLRVIPDAVEVSGPMNPDDKAERLLAFSDREIRVLVTKPSIAGFGMNWQNCGRVYFLGPTHSYEQRYQAIRRCWRYGRKDPVIVRTCESAEEHKIIESQKRKQAQAEEMMQEVLAVTRSLGLSAGASLWEKYMPNVAMEVPAWLR